MSLSLHDRWMKRLELAQNDPSWSAQIEARVLRYLLSRYAGTQEEVPLGNFPFYAGELPHGRGHVPLSGRQLRSRLAHIAQIGHEIPAEPPAYFDAAWEEKAYEERKRQARRRERYHTRHERGYW